MAITNIRAGLIGTGFGGSVVLPALRQVPGMEVAAVCSAHAEKAGAFAAAHGIPDATNNVEALTQRDDLELVLVCTPPLLHAPMSRAALDAGKHTFSTKPLAATATEARQLAEAARAQGVVTAMDLDNRYVPVRRYFRHLVASGYLGTPRCVLSTVLTHHATKPDSRIYFWNWVSVRAQAGGILGASLGLHHLDLLRYTFGELIDIGGLATTQVTEKPVLAPGYSEWSELGPDTPIVGTRACDAEDTVVVHGRLAAGGLFQMTASWSTHHGSGARVEAYGSDGTLVLDTDGVLYGARAKDSELSALEVPPSFGPPSLATDHVGRFVALFGEMAGAIRGEPIDAAYATFDDGLRVREIAEAVTRETE